MNSTLADSSSLISTSTRMVRNNPDRIRPRSDLYLWFFGQIHAKRLLVCLMFTLACLSLYMLTWPIDAHFSGANVSGFDNQELFGIWVHSRTAASSGIMIDDDPLFVRQVTEELTIDSPAAIRKRNILSLVACFYFFSVAMAAGSIRWAEKMWLFGSNTTCYFMNPAVLLFPFLLSILSFAIPLVLWTVSAFRSFVYHNCHDKNPQTIDCKGFWFIFDVCRFVIFPEFLVWCFFVYIFYGCVLGFLYIWRRSSADWKAKETAAASFSWTFRDKHTLLGGRSGQYGLLNNNTNFGSRLMVGRHPGGSTKSTKSDRPTLRGFIDRFDGENLNETRGSCMSGHGDHNRSMGSDICIEVESAGDTDELNGTRRVLDTVVEETGSQESLSHRI